MIEHIAGKLGITGVHNPRGECFANESPSRRLSSEAKTAQSLPHFATPPPTRLTAYRPQGTPHCIPTSPHRNHTKQTVTCLPAPGTESSGTWPAPKPARLLRAFCDHQRKMPTFLFFHCLHFPC